MLRMTPISDAGRAAEYFGTSDAGYYLGADDARREWIGRGAAALGLTGTPEFEPFERLLRGLDPHTGTQLTALLTEDRLAGWDFTASLPKGVTTALERGDTRIREALWQAGREALADVEPSITTRVRKGGRDDDRVTGNLVGLGVEHFETRPTEDDGMPDWDRHLHFVVANLTLDPVERQWKAVKIRPVFDLRKYFSHRFDLRMAAKLVELGYEIETKLRDDPDGGRRYHTWDIKGIPDSVIAKFSRRHQEVEDTEQAILAGMKERDGAAPDALSPVARAKLAATTRRYKRKDMTLADYRDYWNARLTPEEGAAIAATIARAKSGGNPRPHNRAAEAMAYAVAHHFERSSVVDYHDLAVTAMERSMGAARPGDFEPEARRQGVLFAGDQVSTREVLDQEQRIIAFARAGKGVFRPLARGQADGLGGLSPEQQTAVRHVWNSADRVILIRGGAGTGKTTMMKPALERLGAPVVLLAPSADASRGQLRKEGFAAANTVAAFLGREEMQARARGGVIWVDEAGLLPVRDLDALCGVAEKLQARLVLQGDPSQHKSVSRHGNMLNVLEDHAGLPVARLTTIQRQQGDYAQAVAAIRDGEIARGDDVLRRLGWVVEGNGHDALVTEYARAIEEKKPDGRSKSVLVIDPTHRDGDLLTEKLRAVRKDKGLIGAEEHSFPRLVPLSWTDAEKADPGRYGGAETVQFFRNTGRFRAGDRVTAAELLPELDKLKPGHFAVYREATIALAAGDTVRITANGRDTTGKHRVDNGRIDTVRGFTPDGAIVLANGWILGKDFAHIKHGLVQTSHATQSRTDDVVLAAMNRAALGAMSAEQAYVTVSRGRERGMIFTDLPRDELLAAVARGDGRRAATELFGRPETKETPAAATPPPRLRMRTFMEKVRSVSRQLQRKAAAMVREPFRPRSWGYAR